MKEAVLHIDGDSFFASCEVSLNPRLRGLPVVTGHERGIATAMSKEAKALGISRGMPVFKIKKEFPQAVVLHSDYGVYELFAQRMFAIVRRYTDEVEEYSIDECFARLDNSQTIEKLSETVRKIKEDLQRELGMTFSLGLAPTKVLAKLASSSIKPDGLTILLEGDIDEFLNNTDIGKLWGIGPASTRELRQHGIMTALDLKNRRGDWVETVLNKSEGEIWHELNSRSVYKVHSDGRDDSKSIQATRSFLPSTDKSFIFSELSKNVENACTRARRQGLSTQKVHYFLKTQEFRYHRFEVSLDTAQSTPPVIIKGIKDTFNQVYRPRMPYRATGVVFSGLTRKENIQADLFGYRKRSSAWDTLFKTVDSIDKRYGSHSMVLGSSLKAFQKRDDTGFHKRLRIPYMGEIE